MIMEKQKLEMTIRNAKGIRGERQIISCEAGLQL